MGYGGWNRFPPALDAERGPSFDTRIVPDANGEVVLRPVVALDHLHCQPAANVLPRTVKAEVAFHREIVDGLYTQQPVSTAWVRDDNPKYVGHGLPLSTLFDKEGMVVETPGGRGALVVSVSFIVQYAGRETELLFRGRFHVG